VALCLPVLMYLKRADDNHILPGRPMIFRRELPPYPLQLLCGWAGGRVVSPKDGEDLQACRGDFGGIWKSGGCFAKAGYSFTMPGSS
jgi:hypothetical protein